MRIERDELNLTIAGMISLRSQCNRRKVGAVATIDGRIVATGYNNRLGDEKCNKENCNEENPCTGTVHAEQNLIAYAARHGIALENATLYCTDQPCLSCANSIIQAGIKRVVYIRPYRLTEGLDLLRKMNIIIQEMETPKEPIKQFVKSFNNSAQWEYQNIK